MAELQNLGAGDGAGAAAPVAEEPVAQETQEGQAQGQPPPVDLTQFPQFREFQRSTDQRFAQMERQYQQQLAAAQAKADEQAMAGMDDFEKTTYQLDKERREKEELLSLYQNTVAEQYRAQGMAAIAQHYNVPISVLDGRSPEAAELSAVRYQLAQLQQKQGDSQAVETAERNRVDVGGGAATGGEVARLRLELKRAKENNDTRAYTRVMRDAEARGIAIH